MASTLIDQYSYTPGYHQAYENLDKSHDGWGNNSNNLTQAALAFNNQFRNLVGRDPTPDEANQFYSSVLAPNANLYGDANSQQYQALGDTVNSFVNNNFQGAIQDTVNKQLTSQQGEANRLADLFRTQGNQSINNVEQGLLDYQSKLFEKLRPQLLTSLQAQGLLNTGGLNEALAGQQGDLARDAANQVADLRYQNEQGANQIAFGGASAPYQFQQQTALGMLPFAQQQAQNSLSNLFQQRFAQQQFGNQLELQRNANAMQQDNQPGLLGRLGQGFTTSFGASAGQNLGSWVGPGQSGTTNSQGTPNISPLAALFR
jgi:hypothetical protein